MCRAVRSAALVCLLLASASVHAQAAPSTPAPTPKAPSQAQSPGSEPPPAITFGEEVSVETVLVPVAVRSHKGFVADLKGKNFTLWVDGRHVPIESFQQEQTAPLSLIVLQDLSGSMAQLGKLGESRNMLACLLDHAREQDELALASFAGGQTRVEVPLTHDPEPLRESLAIWDAYGTTALYDAVSWLPDISTGAKGLKRAAILVTDGIDNDSHMTPEAARDLVRRAELPVFVVGLETPGDEPAAREGTSTVRYDQLLEDLARTTGGRYYALAESRQVPEVCSAILSELRHQYVLGFSVTGYGRRSFHPIQVAVSGRGGRSTVVYRQGYTGTKPAALERPPGQGTQERSH